MQRFTGFAMGSKRSCKGLGFERKDLWHDSDLLIEAAESDNCNLNFPEFWGQQPMHLMREGFSMNPKLFWRLLLTVHVVGHWICFFKWT